MEQQDVETRGVVQFARRFRIFGVRAYWPGLAVGVVREGRVVELLYGMWCWVEVAFRGRRGTIPATGIAQFAAHYFTILPQDGGLPLRVREQGMVRDGGRVVALEYGDPGARILYSDGGREAVHRPYAGDPGVRHLHAICPLGNDRYIVTTGDTRKYADIVRITADECVIERRLRPRLAGYTALIRIDGKTWGGSDFSERPNFIVDIDTGEKYYLPSMGVKAFVLDIRRAGDLLAVHSVRLYSDTGYVFMFDPTVRRFVAGNRIRVVEVYNEPSPVPHHAGRFSLPDHHVATADPAQPAAAER